jgi:hypothetical protein
MVVPRHRLPSRPPLLGSSYSRPSTASVRGEVTDWVELGARHGGAQSYWVGQGTIVESGDPNRLFPVAKVGFLRPIIMSFAATPRRRGIQGRICALGCLGYSPWRGPIAVESVRKHIKRPGSPIAHPTGGQPSNNEPKRAARLGLLGCLPLRLAPYPCLPDSDSRRGSPRDAATAHARAPTPASAPGPSPPAVAPSAVLPAARLPPPLPAAALPEPPETRAGVAIVATEKETLEGPEQARYFKGAFLARPHDMAAYLLYSLHMPLNLSPSSALPAPPSSSLIPSTRCPPPPPPSSWVEEPCHEWHPRLRLCP